MVMVIAPAGPSTPRAQDYYERRSRRVSPVAKSSLASTATRPGRSSTWSDSCSQDLAYRGCDRSVLISRCRLLAGDGALSVPGRRGVSR